VRFDFTAMCDGTDIFALAIGGNASIYAQRADLSDSHSLRTCWAEVAACDSLSNQCTALSWSFNNSLILATGQQLHAFSRFAMTVRTRKSLTSAPASAEQGMKPSLFRVALGSHTTAPMYHPRVLEEYVR
jgi:hypothetical protein